MWENRSKITGDYKILVYFIQIAPGATSSMLFIEVGAAIAVVSRGKISTVGQIPIVFYAYEQDIYLLSTMARTQTGMQQWWIYGTTNTPMEERN